MTSGAASSNSNIAPPFSTRIAWRSPKSVSERPRWKDYLQTIWCLATDWFGALGPLYRPDRRGPLVWLGEQGQVMWFRAHNCRFYNWLDQREP